MKKQPLLYIYVAFICTIIFFSFVSCKQKTTQIDPEFARYIAAFTYGNISPDSYIEIELAQELPSVELNTEVQEKFFSFSPFIKGKTYWINSRTIRFVPEYGQLKPGKEYTAKFYLDKALKVEPKFKTFNFYFRVNEQNFSFDLLPYSPMSINDLKWNSVTGALRLANNESPEKIVGIFELKGANREAKVNVKTVSDGMYQISIDSLLRTNNAESYELTVNGNAIGAKKRENFSIQLPSLPETEFQVIDVRMISETASHIRIAFSSPLSHDQDIQGLVVPSGISNFTYQIDKNVLKIFPEAYPREEITLQIHQGLRSFENRALARDYTYQLRAESEKPQVKMGKSGNILPNSSQLVLPFSAVNLWAVDVKVIKIYQNNILYFLQSNSMNSNSNGEVRRFGRLIKKKQIRLDTDKTLDLTRWNNFSIDLAPMINEDPGAIYIVQLSMKSDYSLFNCGGITPQIPQSSSMRNFEDENISEEDEAVWDETNPYYYEPIDWAEYNWEERDDPCKSTYYMNRDRIIETTVMASNMGIIAKGGDENKILIAVTDILSTSPISGADVTVYNYQMQAIGKGKTDGQGFAEIDYKNGKPFVVTATNGKDIGYLEVKEELSLSLSNFDVSGKEIQKGLKGSVYGERGVWRPGDTIYLSFILEDRAKKLPEGHPVALEVYTPTRQFYHRQVKTNGENGFYTFQIVTDPSAPTGVWQSYVKVGGTSFYKPLRIETVKPNRLKVRLETDSIIDASKGVFSGTLTSQWLHGAPASNLKSEVEITLSRTENPFSGYNKYVFNNPLFKFETNSYKLFEGTLNASGVAGVNSRIPVAESAPGMLRGNIVSRVFETGGDMSFYAQTAYYSPYGVYAGVKTPETEASGFLETDKPIVFDVVTLDPYGKKVSRDNVEYKIYKLNWSWWWNSSEEDLGSYVNNTAVSPVANGVISTSGGSGKVKFQVDYPDWGRYLILVKDAGSGHTAGTIFYVDWPSTYGRSNKTDPNGLTMLSFSTDKETYAVGETATVIIPKSSSGRALISIENGSSIIWKEWIKTSETEDTEYRFKITEEMNPNFYLFITLLQPHAQTENDLPIRLYGVRNINVEDKNSKLQPIIQMPNELSPEKEFSVLISEKTKKSMTYTLAIVDEGLLDLTSFKTPNAWNEFYAREALGVRTWDLFDRVLGANTGMIGPLLSIGGDEALKASSDKVNRFKPVVKFLGPFTIKNGETKTHKIKLPPYVGSVRVMVVAGGNGAYGSAEKTVAVKNALMTLSTLPRVLGPGEEVWLPVNVFAMDRKVKNVQVSVQTGGLLKLLDGASKSVSFNATGDTIVYFTLKAGNSTGAEQVRIKASGGGESVSETIDIGIRNPNPPVVISQSVLIDPNGNAQLALNPGNVNPTDWAKLELSRIPSVNLNKNLSYLAEYPHGCTEQVTSQGFPLLYLGNFVSLSDGEKELTNKKIASVIQVLSSRQLPDGGFVYWPGQGFASEWASTYAGHFLVEAKNKGFDVSQSVIGRWVGFQQKLARNWTRIDSHRGYYGISMTELQQAYRLYALALSGNTELGAMNRMREIADLNLQAKWRLAAAYALAGKPDVANSLVFNASDAVEDYRSNNDTYGSPARDKAMIMQTYLLLGNIEKALQLAPDVSRALSSDYISTQTVAFGLMAMAQLAEKMGSGNIDVDWTLNGKKMAAVNTPHAFHQVDLKTAPNQSVQISNKGKGKVYARLTAFMQPLVDTLRAAEGSLRLSVNYLDAAGKPLDVKSLKQGTEFTAVVTVRNSVEQSFTDLALLQVFPSGWEIFNERLTGTQSAAETYNYRDIRDDRVLTYFNLGAGQSATFRARLQAAYRGNYYLPAVSCQAMYEPREQARTTGIWVEVR